MPRFVPDDGSEVTAQRTGSTPRRSSAMRSQRLFAPVAERKVPPRVKADPPPPWLSPPKPPGPRLIGVPKDTSASGAEPEPVFALPGDPGHPDVLRWNKPKPPAPGTLAPPSKATEPPHGSQRALEANVRTVVSSVPNRPKAKFDQIPKVFRAGQRTIGDVDRHGRASISST